MRSKAGRAGRLGSRINGLARFTRVRPAGRAEGMRVRKFLEAVATAIPAAAWFVFAGPVLLALGGSDLLGGAARDDAALILSRDANLQSPRGQALRHLLYLFGKDEAIKLIRAG